MLKIYFSKEVRGMKIYSKLKIVVLELKEDVITTSNGADNVVAGNSGWTGWTEGGLEE